MFTRARRDLDGPPFTFPAVIDRCAERWWRARPRTRVLAVSSLAVLVLMAGIATATAAPHGPPTPVWTATRDLVVGDTLASSDLRRTTLPADLVPDGALAEPQGTLAAPLPRGAIATDRHLGEAGVGAGLPPGTVAVPVPLEALPELPAGALIDLVASDVSGGTHLLASGARVLHDDGTVRWLAVDQASAAQVAAATLHGPVGVVVLPDGP